MSFYPDVTEHGLVELAKLWKQQKISRTDKNWKLICEINS